jgi:hypothetical protein
MLHAWQCRTCDTRNAPSLGRCRACGAAAASGEPVYPSAPSPPTPGRLAWDALRTACVVGVWLPVLGFGLLLMFILPTIPFHVWLLILIVWLLCRIAESVSKALG